MAVEILTMINPGDYDAFLRLMQDHLSNTYDEWGKLHVQEAADCLALGHTYREVKVSPDEFSRFLAARRTAPHLKSLHDFAREKVAGNSY